MGTSLTVRHRCMEGAQRARSRTATIGSLVALCLLVAGTRAEAESAEAEVRRLDAHAADLVQREDWAGALAELEAAQAVLPATARVYNVARCHEELGNLTLALAHYQRFLELPDAPRDRWELASRRVEALRRQLEATPAPPPAGVADEPAPASDAPPAERAPERRRLSPTVFYALLATTAAAGIGLAVTGGLALRDQGDFEQTQVGSDEGRRLREHGEPLALAADILIGVTAASAVATLVVALLTRWRRGSERGSTAGWSLRAARSVALTVRF